MTLVIFSCPAENLMSSVAKSIKVEIDCLPKVSIDEIFHVSYKLQLTLDNDISPEFILQLKETKSKNAKLLYFSQTARSSSYRLVHGKLQRTIVETWTATYKPLKKGKFITPDYIIKGIDPTSHTEPFILDLTPQKTTIQIVDKERGSKNENKKSNNADIKKIEKNEPVFLNIELPIGEYAVGETIKAKVFVLLKNLDIRYQLNNLELDKKIKIKNADYKFIPVDQALHPIKHNGEIYEGALVYILEITPEKTGEITIPKIKMKGTGNLIENNAYWGAIVGEKFKFECQSTPVKFRVTEKRKYHKKSEDFSI